MYTYVYGKWSGSDAIVSNFPTGHFLLNYTQIHHPTTHSLSTPNLWIYHYQHYSIYTYPLIHSPY